MEKDDKDFIKTIGILILAILLAPVYVFISILGLFSFFILVTEILPDGFAFSVSLFVFLLWCYITVRLPFELSCLYINRKELGVD